MAKTYETLRLGGRHWELHAAPDCDQCKFQARMRNRGAARQWLQQFKRDSSAMKELRRMLALENLSLRLDRASDDAILEQAAIMFETGRWLVSAPGHHTDTQSVSGEGGKSQSGKSDQDQAGASGQSTALLTDRRSSGAGDTGKKSASKELTWVEIRLLDTAGKPVGGVAFELKLPDGEVKSGKLDDSGIARFDQILPGQCEVRFPGLDGAEWKPA
jgi:hypothetical protein